MGTDQTRPTDCEGKGKEKKKKEADRGSKKTNGARGRACRVHRVGGASCSFIRIDIDTALHCTCTYTAGNRNSSTAEQAPGCPP